MNADLLKKIRKCLQLAKSSNEHEAAAALEKARQLMDEYGVSAEDVELAEVEEASAKGSCNQRPAAWETLLCRTVRHALGVDVVISITGERIYFGLGPSAEIASYAFVVLNRQLKSARQHYIRTVLKRCGPARKRQRADVYCEAWAVAVYSKVQAFMPKRDTDPLIGSYIARRFSNLGQVTPRGASYKGGRVSNDYWNGHDAGSDVSLANGVGGKAQTLALT